MLPDTYQTTDFIDTDPPCNPPSNGKPGGKRHWSFAEVQEDMVEAMVLWFRTPGGGCSPFAKDGPWHLIREADRELEAQRILNAAAEGRLVTPKARPLPLTRAEVARRDRVSEWLLLAPEADRQLIAIVLGELAYGVKRVSWKRVRQQVAAENSPRGLGMRYSRAVTRIAQALSKLREPRPWATEEQGQRDAWRHIAEPAKR